MTPARQPIATFPRELLDQLRTVRHLVVFTGAGVSAESGIPTFRDALTGLWAQFDPARLATPEAFAADPSLVWGWYEWRRGLVAGCAPNAAHLAIAELQRRVPRLTLVTQNVDGLHERAGSARVIALHGSLHQPRCVDCGHPHVAPPRPQVARGSGSRLEPPLCDRCRGYIRPGVVWFGEPLPIDAWKAALAAVEDCDMLWSVGTSSLVYPAAHLPFMARERGAKVVQINPAETSLDGVADINLRGAAAELIPALLSAAWPDSSGF